MMLEGALIVVFSYITDLGSAIVVMTLFSIFVQACEGATYGIVPYVDPKNGGEDSARVFTARRFARSCQPESL